MEWVMLVDTQDQVLGTMEKMEAHRKGLLHRAFSVFIFNSQQQMLLQQRTDDKYHSGGLWTNACCSHPRPGEETLNAAQRRLKEEMGFEAPLRQIFEFTYKADFPRGLTEHEFDHVLIGTYDGAVLPDSREVKAYTWTPVAEIERLLARNPEQFTAWFHIAFPLVKNWHEEQGAV